MNRTFIPNGVRRGLRSLALAGLLGAAASGAALAQPVIPDRFGDILEVDAPGTAQGIARCVGAPGGESIEPDLQAIAASGDSDLPREYVRDSSPGVALLTRGFWTCLPLSPARFPVWPLEVMQAVVHVASAPPQDMADWHRALLERLAQRGQAVGLVVYPNGNGLLLTFTAQPGTGMYLKYTTKFLKPDAVDESIAHAVIRPTKIGGIRIVNALDPARPDFAGHPVLPASRMAWPLEGDYVKPPPGPVNHQMVYEGTQWRNAQNTRLWLQPQGVVVLSTPRSTSSGIWEARNGVVYVKLNQGVWYSLRVSMDGLSLNGRARINPAPVKAAPDVLNGFDLGPRQWTMRLERVTD